MTVCGLQPAKSVFISWVESVGGYNLGDDEPASKIDQNRPRLTLDPQPFFSTAALTTPRLQKKTGGPLPSPREVSTRVHDFDRRRLSRRATVMLMDWGQFLAHDITGTPVGKSASWRGRRGGWGSCLHSRSFDAWVGWDRIFIPGALTGGWVGIVFSFPEV